MVGSLLVRLGRRTEHRTPATEVLRKANEWTLAEPCHQLDTPQPTLYRWLQRGLLKGRQVTQQGHPLWLIEADEAERKQLPSRRVAADRKPWPATIDS